MIAQIQSGKVGDSSYEAERFRADGSRMWLRARCTPVRVNPEFELILINLDRFKLFNEAHGPSMGDNVLKAVGIGLRRVIPIEHEVMRLAGDEFALVSSAHGKGETAVDTGYVLPAGRKGF